MKKILLCGLVLLALGSGWWLFGWSTYRRGQSRITMHRSFGRVTRVDSVVVANGATTRERLLYTWSHPFVNGFAMSDCAAIHPEMWQDRNGDGRWDTWLYRVGPDPGGHCQIEYRVDTKATGRPDWVFILPYGQHEKADAMIKARRGF